MGSWSSKWALGAESGLLPIFDTTSHSDEISSLDEISYCDVISSLEEENIFIGLYKVVQL